MNHTDPMNDFSHWFSVVKGVRVGDQKWKKKLIIKTYKAFLETRESPSNL